MGLKEYKVVGRQLPTEKMPVPKLYQMSIFAPNELVAKSRFWYFLGRLRKVKRAHGEILLVEQIKEEGPVRVKNFGVWLRYDSRSGTHNMYKEVRALTRTEAIEELYHGMASVHRALFSSIHILKVVEIENPDDVKRPYIRQLIDKDLKFPLPHRVKKCNALYVRRRPSTFY